MNSPGSKLSTLIDFTRWQAIQEIFPEMPKSLSCLCPGAHLGYFHQPTHETPAFIPQQHTFSIILTRRLVVEQWWDRSFHSKEQMAYGNISFYPAERVQRHRWDQTIEFLDLYIDPAWLDPILQRLGLASVELLPHPVITDPIIRQLGLQIRADFQSGQLNPQSGSLYLQSLVNLFLLYFLKLKSDSCLTLIPTGLSPTSLQLAINYIRDHLDQNLSLADVAGSVHLSPNYFATLFKQSTGKSPHHYITERRIDYAKQLLAERDLPILDLCKQVGFQCPSHFAKIFRESTGVTPKRYRQSLSI